MLDAGILYSENVYGCCKELHITND